MVALLQRALENVSIARQAIDALLKMDIEQTRMRFCFSEFQEVQRLKVKVNHTGHQKLEEILHRDKYFHSRSSETSCRRHGFICQEISHDGTQIPPTIRSSQTRRQKTAIKNEIFVIKCTVHIKESLLLIHHCIS